MCVRTSTPQSLHRGGLKCIYSLCSRKKYIVFQPPKQTLTSHLSCEKTDCKLRFTSFSSCVSADIWLIVSRLIFLELDEVASSFWTAVRMLPNLRIGIPLQVFVYTLQGAQAASLRATGGQIVCFISDARQVKSTWEHVGNARREERI